MLTSMPRKALALTLGFLLFLVLGLRAEAQGGTQCTDPEAVLRAYLAKTYHGEPVVVLAMDHRSQEWSGFDWDGHATRSLEPDAELKVPFTNKPRVYLRTEDRDRLVVLVFNTNPLLYTTRLTGITETALEDLESLKKLAGLLGGVLSAAVTTTAPRFEMPSVAADLKASAVAVQSFEAARDKLDFLMTQPVPAAAPLDLPLLRAEASRLIDALQPRTSALNSALQGLEAPRSALEREVQQLDEAAADMRVYLQLVENDTLDPVRPRRFESLSVTPASIDDLAERIALARDAVTGVSPVCVQALTALRTAVRLRRLPLPPAGAAAKGATDEYVAALAALKDLGTCATPEIRSPVEELRDLLAAGPGPTGTGTQDQEDEVLRALHQGIHGYLTVVDKRASALKTSGELLKLMGSSGKAAQAARVFVDRWNGALLGNDPCSLRTGVIEVDRHEDLTVKLPWTKFGAETFQVVAESPFKDDVVPSFPKELSASYELQRAFRWNFDVDVATIYTEVTDPVFTEVTIPNEETENPSDTLKVIRQTDEKSRAGELAVLLSLQWRSRQPVRQRFSIGPQLGAGVSTDQPAFFAGVGVGFGRFFKLGAGWTWQEVKELDRQEVGQILGTGEALRQRDGFDDGFYASLSIAIDELPFFKAP